MKKNYLNLDRILDIETPAVVVDRQVLDQNIARGAEIARAAGAAYRPHMKTHKSIRIAALQMAAGAVGVTAAKPSEAIIFMQRGLRDVTVAYPMIDPHKVERLMRVAQHTGSTLRLVADSMEGVEAISAASAACDAKIAVLIEVDVGLRRCGVDPDGPHAGRLAERLQADPFTTFAGLLSHAGHAYGAEDAASVKRIAEEERRLMTGLAQNLRQSGIGVPIVSVGSTPTVWLSDNFDGITELRPGNAVFMDLTQVSLGVASPKDLALSVLATVVSVNQHFAIVDAGSKVLSSDVGPHGSKRLTGYGIACLPDDPSLRLPVVNLSEEHGFLAHAGRPPRIGARVRIWPNHACPVANLADKLVVLQNDEIREEWSVDARGCVR
jgi:D-serine deaminase-like pyridoxal phosphate-dependent protein